MSSWLDNIAAHVAEEEEDYESQSHIKIPPQENQSQNQTSEPPKQQEKAEQSPQEKVAPSEKTDIGHNNDEEKESPKDLKQNVGKNEPDNSKKVQEYTGTITKEMVAFDKAINSLHKKQEFYYAGSMIRTRSSVDSALEKTSRPIQTIGGLGTVSLKAKEKYDALRKNIMSLKPLCNVNPKSK